MYLAIGPFCYGTGEDEHEAIFNMLEAWGILSAGEVREEKIMLFKGEDLHIDGLGGVYSEKGVEEVPVPEWVNELHKRRHEYRDALMELSANLNHAMGRIMELNDDHISDELCREISSLTQRVDSLY